MGVLFQSPAHRARKGIFMQGIDPVYALRGRAQPALRGYSPSTVRSGSR